MVLYSTLSLYLSVDKIKCDMREVASYIKFYETLTISYK